METYPETQTSTQSPAGTWDSAAVLVLSVQYASPSVRKEAWMTDAAMAQLRRLGELKKEGLLTYEQFEAQKQRLLS